MRWAVLVVMVACKSSSPSETGAGSAAANQAPAMTTQEIQRSHDACEDYVTRACACAKSVPAAKSACDLSKALPEAVQIGVEVANNPETSSKDALDAQRSVRKAVSQCIEQTAKLASLGCP